jgi:cytochrome c oxidase cbb3-type subunit 1
MNVTKLKENRAAYLFLVSACAFLLVGMGIGIFVALKFLFPELGRYPLFSFGRLRTAHTNVVLFAFLLQADIGMILYIIPKLLHTKLFSEKLGIATWAIFNVAAVGGVARILMGINQNVEYAEIAPPFNYLIILAWVLLLINVLGTIIRRKVRSFYVSVWYVVGTLLWTAVVYITGSILTQYTSGLNQANLSWFYVHNAVGLVFTPCGLAAAYYLIPKVLNTPIYSHKLSLIGFWVIAFTYCWTGAHHMIHGPNSYWLETVAILFSWSLIIPVIAVVTNFFGTYVTAPKSERFKTAEAKLLFVGTVYYLLTCLQGPFQSIRSINTLVSKTDWVVAHAHMAVLGCFALYAMAGAYYMIPRIVKRPLYSQRLANVHFWLTFVGLLMFIWPMFVTGPMQGLGWLNIERTFLEILAEQRWVWFVRMGSGVLILFAQTLFFYNLWETLYGKSYFMKPIKEKVA